jgi:hypothetical protein
MKQTLQTLIMLIMVAVSYHASAQCTITPSIIPNGATTFCAGDSVQLGTDSVYVSYLWSTGQTTATIYAYTAGNYTVYITDSYGCTGTSAVTVVTVVQGPPQQTGAITGATYVCSGSVQTYSIPSDSTATSYFWTFPGGWWGSSTTTSITVTVGSTSGNVSVLAANSCGISNNTTILAVTVSTAPGSACPIIGNMIVQQGSAQIYSVAAVVGATSYTWTLPSGWTGSSTTTSITVSVGAGSGNICVTANNSCGSSGACCVPVYIYSGNCFALFTLYPDTNILHHYFIIDTLLGVPPLQYNWSWGDGNFDTIAFPSHTYLDSGIYSICLTTTDSNGCQSNFCNNNYHILRTMSQMVQVDVVHSLTVGIKQPDKANSISLFPNPNSGNFTLSYYLNNNTNADFKIMDVTGRKVYSMIISGTDGKQTISVNDLSNGIYFYQITNDKETLRGKFVVEK